MATSYKSTGFAASANLVATHVSVLTAVGALPEIPGARRIAARPTAVYDLNGELLFWRAAIVGAADSYVDIAAHPALGGPLVSVSRGVAWTPDDLVAEARRSLPKRLATGVDATRFVAYSYPKVAVQFLRDGAEVALVELFTNARVPEQRQRDEDEPPGNFERWSYLDELPSRRRRANERRHALQIEGLSDLAQRLDIRDRRLISIDEVDWLGISTDSRELHYSGRATEHATCYELRG